MLNWWILTTVDCEMRWYSSMAPSRMIWKPLSPENSWFILRRPTSSSQWTLSSLDDATSVFIGCHKTYLWQWLNRKSYCQLSFGRDKTIQHYHSYHSERKNRYGCDTKELRVSTSGSVSKILTRPYGHKISFMCLCRIVNDDTREQLCLISVITGPSTEEWRNTVTPATDCHFSFTLPLENSR